MKTDIPRGSGSSVLFVLLLSLVTSNSTASEVFSLSSFQASSQLLIMTEPVPHTFPGNKKQSGPVPIANQGSQLRVREKKSKFYLALLMALKNR